MYNAMRSPSKTRSAYLWPTISVSRMCPNRRGQGYLSYPGVGATDSGDVLGGRTGAAWCGACPRSLPGRLRTFPPCTGVSIHRWGALGCEDAPPAYLHAYNPWLHRHSTLSHETPPSPQVTVRSVTRRGNGFHNIHCLRGG